MPMNITAIQTFLSVVRTRNLNRAADEMNVTQSAVTARLDALEAQLGAKLLIRSRKGAELTKAGFAFLDQAELIARTWENARARLSLPEGVTRLCSLVIEPGLWAGLAAPWVAELRATHGETAFEIWSGLASDAARWLQSGLSDAALLCEPLTGPDISTRLFSTEPLVQVATRPRPVMTWDPDYVFVDYGRAFRAHHAAAWPGDDTAGLSFSTPDWALSHLLEHGGSAYLPLGLAAPHITEKHLFRIDGATQFERRTYLSWRKSGKDTFPWPTP